MRANNSPWMRLALIAATLLLCGGCASTKPTTVSEVYLNYAASNLRGDGQGWVAQPFSNTLGPGSIFVRDANENELPFMRLATVTSEPLGGPMFGEMLKVHQVVDAEALREKLGVESLVIGDIRNGSALVASGNCAAGAEFNFGLTSSGVPRRPDFAAELSTVLKSATEIKLEIGRAAVVDLELARYLQLIECMPAVSAAQRAIRGRQLRICTRAVAAENVVVKFTLDREVNAELKTKLQGKIVGDDGNAHAALSVYFVDDRTLSFSTAKDVTVYIECLLVNIPEEMDRSYGEVIPNTGKAISFVSGSGFNAKEVDFPFFRDVIILDATPDAPAPNICFRSLEIGVLQELGFSVDQAHFYNSNLDDLSVGLRVAVMNSGSTDWPTISAEFEKSVKSSWSELGYSPFDVAAGVQIANALAQHSGALVADLKSRF